MTPVVQVVPIHDTIIFDGMPAAWLNHSDFSPFFGRHNLFADICISNAASSKRIQFGIGLERFCGVITLRKKRFVGVDDCVCRCSIVLQNTFFCIFCCICGLPGAGCFAVHFFGWAVCLGLAAFRILAVLRDFLLCIKFQRGCQIFRACTSGNGYSENRKDH